MIYVEIIICAKRCRLRSLPIRQGRQPVRHVVGHAGRVDEALILVLRESAQVEAGYAERLFVPGKRVRMAGGAFSDIEAA